MIIIHKYIIININLKFKHHFKCKKIYNVNNIDNFSKNITTTTSWMIWWPKFYHFILPTWNNKLFAFYITQRSDPIFMSFNPSHIIYCFANSHIPNFYCLIITTWSDSYTIIQIYYRIYNAFYFFKFLIYIYKFLIKNFINHYVQEKFWLIKFMMCFALLNPIK